MSRRNRNRNQSVAPAASAPELTVVDGNAVGVSPAGAVDTTTDDSVDAALAAIDAEMNERAEVVALAEVEEDPEIAALLAEVEGNVTVTTADDVGEPAITETAIDAAAEDETTDEDAPIAHTVEDVVENLAAVTDDDVAAVIENDADALLAELDAASANTTTATPATKPKRQKASPPPAAPKRDFHSVAAIDPTTLKANLDACSAQKVQEKAQNLIQSIEIGKRLSRYTSVAIHRLANDGKISSKSLVETYEAAGLKTGTARAQAQQMTALFKIAGIAIPDASAPRELVIADKGLVEELTKLAA